jgi:hypothetical protein
MSIFSFCHSRESGNPWPDLTLQKVHAEAQRRRGLALRPLRLCVNSFFRRPSAGWGLSRLSAKWFAQRHEGIKKLLPVFVSSCELKTYRARKYKTMGSRFRGNDNVGFMASVSRYSSLRWSDGVCGGVH